MSEEQKVSEQAAQDMLWHRYKKYPYLLAKFTLFAAVLFVLYTCLRTVESVAFPLFLSMLIAYLLDPTIDKFEARGINRTSAILITIVIMLLAGVGFFAFLYPLLAGQVSTVVKKAPGLVDSIQNEFLPWLQSKAKVELPATLSDALSKYGKEIQNAAPTLIKKVGNWGTSLVSQTGVVVASLLNIVMIPIFTFYFLRDFDKMRLSAAEYIPDYCKSFVIDRLTMMDDVVGAWFRGQIQVGLILALLYGVGLGAVFGFAGLSVFEGVALGVVTGVLNVVPYLGFAIGLILSVLVVLIDWTGIGTLVGVGVVFLVVQVAEGYVITPKVVGEKVGLSSVTVIIVLLLGGEIAGLLGVLLAIPVAGAIKVILPDVAYYYKKSAYFTGASGNPAIKAMVRDEYDHPSEEIDIRETLQHDLGLQRHPEIEEKLKLEEELVEKAINKAASTTEPDPEVVEDESVSVSEKTVDADVEASDEAQAEESTEESDSKGT